MVKCPLIGMEDVRRLYRIPTDPLLASTTVARRRWRPSALRQMSRGGLSKARVRAAFEIVAAGRYRLASLADGVVGVATLRRAATAA